MAGHSARALRDRASRRVIGVVAILAVAACGGGERNSPGNASSKAAGYPVAKFAELNGQDLPPKQAAALQDALRAAAGDNGATAALITEDGTWAGATGTADGTRPLTPDTQMAIGSITKSVVAAQLMQLVEDGDLSLDDLAADHLPEDLEFDSNGATVGDLLAMRSGIPDHVDSIFDTFETDPAHTWTTDELLALVPAGRSRAGVDFDYSNTNYILAGLILERLTRSRVAEALRDGVLSGPGFERLVYQTDEHPTEPVASRDGKPALAANHGGRYLPSLAGASAAGAAGGIASDARTLARWWAQLCGGRIVSAKSLDTMTDFRRTPNYALGIQDWSAEDGPFAIGNDGAHLGFVSHAECLPEQRQVVVVLVNNGEANAAEIAHAVTAALTSP